MAEADGIAAPAIEMLEDEAGVACAEEVAPEPEADRRREARAVSQKVVDDLGVGLTANPLQVGNVVDAAHEGTALRHVAELDAQAPVLDDGRDLALADRPARAPFLTAKPPSGGALDVLVVAHPDAEAACESVEPFDQRGLRLAGFGALAELCQEGGEGVLGRRPECWHILLHRSMSAPYRAVRRLSR